MKERESGAWDIVRYAAYSVGVVIISQFVFSQDVKNKVRSEQSNVCRDCGRRVAKLEVHHKVPWSLKGSDHKINAVGLCHRCHEKWNKKALEMGIIFPGINIEDMPHIYFRKEKRQRASIQPKPAFVFASGGR